MDGTGSPVPTPPGVEFYWAAQARCGLALLRGNVSSPALMNLGPALSHCPARGGANTRRDIFLKSYI